MFGTICKNIPVYPSQGTTLLSAGAPRGMDGIAKRHCPVLTGLIGVPTS